MLRAGSPGARHHNKIVKLQASAPLPALGRLSCGGLAGGEELDDDEGENAALTCEQLDRAGHAARFWKCAADYRGAGAACQLTRFCLIKLSKFMRADLCAGWRADFDDRRYARRPLACKLHRLCAGPTWLQLVRLFFLYFSLKFALQTVLQQAHNVYHLSVKRLAAPNQKQPPPAAMRAQLEAEQASLAWFSAALETIGAPYFDYSFAVVALNCYLLACAYATYLHTSVFYSFKHLFDYSIVRALLSGALEQRHQVHRHICDQVNRFLSSSENFLKSRLHELELMLDAQARPLAAFGGRLVVAYEQQHAATRQLSGSSEELYRLKAARLARRQATICAQLRRLALEGRLQPPNRNGVWVSKVALVHALLVAAIFFAGNAVINCLMLGPFVGPPSSMRKPRARPRDLLMSAEMFLYGQLALTCVLFYLPILTISCVDQIQHVLALMGNIEAAVRANDRWLSGQAERARGCPLWRRRRDRQQPQSLEATDSSRREQLEAAGALRVASCPQAADAVKASAVDVKTLAARRRELLARLNVKFQRPIRLEMGGESCSKPANAVGGPVKRLSGSTRQLLDLLHCSNKPAAANESNGAGQKQLNLELVVVILQFKIFVQQMRSIKPANATGSSICVTLMSLIPILSRVFAHHLDSDLKLLLLTTSFVFIIFCDFFIVPNCYLHSRCLDLYKRLWRLMARSIEVTHVEERARGSCEQGAEGQIYDCHTIWLLRKELSLPEKSLSQFVPTVLHLQLTYASLLRVHFWCGLLLISMFYADSSQQTTGGLLDDSLHFF